MLTAPLFVGSFRECPNVVVAYALEADTIRAKLLSLPIASVHTRPLTVVLLAGRQTFTYGETATNDATGLAVGADSLKSRIADADFEYKRS